ncbi:hypothetical protein SAMN02745221_02005 [Thermosyntropha lipolytica DSM 11003]|uniref:Uncharacterized protein n=1 Tax=Thermosyntropha lipolytica DSM 11003 TaxID=1123382 RepID=A0A1M5RES6_9FIRM|nr:hypothetical protein [Thermosyntropha lipolytica]SHH24293.1 hypothetical protein SAMN02745221_02005 [Thermosyntropha lipolytica DSM 11003]
MQLLRIENFHLTDRNKAAGDAYFACDGQEYRAELIFYLQGYQCLSIRVGRHDPSLNTRDIEDYVERHSRELRQQVQPEVERVKKEREKMLNSLQ